MKINNNDINSLTNNFLEINLITNRVNVSEISIDDNAIQEISFLLSNHLTKAVHK